MGSSTQTTNLALSQFADADRPTWRGDYNSDMTKIDTAHAALEGQLNGKEDKASVNGDIDTHLGGDSTGLAIAAERGVSTRIYVSANGADANAGLTESHAKATIAAAVSAMGTTPGTIVLGAGTIDVGAGFAWPATAKCSMIGQGVNRTTIYASAQNGPILNLSAVGYGLDGCEFGGFTLNGNGTAGSANKGLVLSGTLSMGRSYFHDIAVMNTGGACFDLGMSELCDFDRLIAWTPVNAATADIPYLIATGAFNGNRLSRLQLQGVTGTNVGPSGAVILKDDGVAYSPHDNHFETPRTEALHLSSGSTIFAFAGSSNVLSDPQFFDTNKQSGATGTSFVRLTQPAYSNFGGNLIRGAIPGNGGTAVAVDCGIDMRQSNNYVTGVKGYDGTNVILGVGVGNTKIDLSGAYSTATKPAVIDTSGTSTNYVSDSYLGQFAGNGTGVRFPISNCYYGPGIHTPGTVAATANTAYAIPMWLPCAIGVTSIQCQVTTAGASGTTIRLGIYSSSANDRPGTLLVDAGTVDGSTTGIKAASLTQQLPGGGLYWLVACCQGGSATLTSVGSGSLPPVASGSPFLGGINTYTASNVTGALPASFPSPGAFSGGIKVVVQAQ